MNKAIFEFAEPKSCIDCIFVIFKDYKWYITGDYVNSGVYNGNRVESCPLKIVDEVVEETMSKIPQVVCHCCFGLGVIEEEANDECPYCDGTGFYDDIDYDEEDSE